MFKEKLFSISKHKEYTHVTLQAKYEHLIGKEAAVEAARKTEANKSYGMVSAESKKDKRTVEQVKLTPLFILRSGAPL